MIDDAVLANTARAQGFDLRPEVRLTMTGARARATVDRVKAEVRQSRRRPTTRSTISSAVRWLDVDAPETMLVVHAVALRPREPGAHANRPRGTWPRPSRRP